MEPKYLSKKQACALLGISQRTLERRIERGEIKVAAKDADGGRWGQVWFTRESLGLPEQESVTNFVTHHEQASVANSATHPERSAPSADQPLTEAEQRIADDLQFAHEYLTGQVSDSFGSTITETKHTALGPCPPVERHRPDSTAHMDQRLLGTNKLTFGTDGQPVMHAGSGNHPLLAGFKGAEAPQKTPHPNAIRQMILADIRRGYSR